MQAEGDVVRFPREAEAPPDFTAFFAGGSGAIWLDDRTLLVGA
ncbi:MAG: hypothetical protein ACRDGK_01815 [Actinomycetota bacterium]